MRRLAILTFVLLAAATGAKALRRPDAPALPPMNGAVTMTVMEAVLPDANGQQSGTPGVITITPAPGYNMELPGDTLAYNITWGAGPRATGYAVTVNATPSTGWLNLPNGFIQTGTVFLLRAVNTTQPDVNFTVTVCSRKGTTTYTNKCSVASWAVTRIPGPPGIPTVDSSMTIVGLREWEMLPETANVWTTISAAQWSAWDAACTGCSQGYKDSVHVNYTQHAQMQFCSIGHFTDNSRYPLGYFGAPADSVYCLNQTQLKYPGVGNSPNARALAKTICINYRTEGAPTPGTITPMLCEPPYQPTTPGTAPS